MQPFIRSPVINLRLYLYLGRANASTKLKDMQIEESDSDIERQENGETEMVIPFHLYTNIDTISFAL